MFAKTVVALVSAFCVASSDAAAVDFMTCTFSAVESSGAAGTGKITQDGSTYKVVTMLTNIGTNTAKAVVTSVAAKPTALPVQTGTGYTEVTGLTPAVGTVEAAFPTSGDVTTANVKAITLAKSDNVATAHCPLAAAVTTTAGATVLTVPVLAAAGLILSLTL